MRRKLNVKLVTGTLGGLLILSASTYALHEFQVRRNAHQLLEQADRAVEEKDYERALQLYPQYLSFAPNDPDTNQKYAQVLDRSPGSVGERIRLVLLMDQVLRVKPNEDAFRLRLVHNLLALGRTAEALEHLQKLLPRAQDKAEVHHMIGWSLEALRDYSQAAKSFEMAVKLDPKRIESYALLVEVLQERLHQADAALQLMNDMVQANPDSHQAYLMRARFQRRRGDEQAAASDLQMASKLRPDDPDVILERADAARARGQWDEADRLVKDGAKKHPHFAPFQKAFIESVPPPRTIARMVEVLLARREYDKADAALAWYEQKAPLTPELARLGAEAALGKRDRTFARLAVRRAEQAVALPSRDYRDYLWLAPIYRAAGDDVQAEKMLQAALELASHAPDVWIAWLEHLALTNQRGLATQEIERLKTELPTDRQALTLARCYDAMHFQNAAAKAYEDALKEWPNDFVLLAYAADFARRADQPDRARSLYERLLDPALAAPAESVVRARRHLAVLLAKDDRQRALTLLALNVKSRGDTPADERIRYYVQGQDEHSHVEAIKQFENALRRQPPTPDERVLLAELQEAAGNLGAARSQLSAAVDEAPTEPRYLVRFARLLIRIGEWEEAARVIARLEALEPASERVSAVKASLVRAEQNGKAQMP
jgi:tetratricopeptide (TPR) repeat protein